jgi:hypothetical protein
MHIINRNITVDGVEYPQGTAVESLPARVRESVVSTGWASPMAMPSPDVDPIDPAPADAPKPKAKR